MWKSIYEVPLKLHAEGLDDRILELLEMNGPEQQSHCVGNDRSESRSIRPRHVTIALVGKYIELKEAYKSLCEALTHGGIANDAKVTISWVDSEDIESKGAQEMLQGHGRHPGPGRIRHPRRRREDRRGKISRGRAKYPTSASVSACSAP